MAATFQFSESNLVGEVVQDNITNLNFGDIDDHELVPSSYPIVVGTNSYEKFLRAKFGGTGWTEISNMKFWKSLGAYKTGENIKVDEVTAYATPVKTTSSRAVTTAPVDLAGAIVVHSAAGTTTITVAGYTRYICLQLQTSGSTPSGALNTKTWTFQYDEV